MRQLLSKMVVLFAVALTFLTAAPSTGRALERGKDGYFKTGYGVRVKKIAFIGIKVYAVDHYMKELPPTASKAAMINLDVDKKFDWRMLRGVSAKRIRDGFRESYARVGYTDQSKIDRFLGAISGDLKKGASVIISYDAAHKTTTITAQGGSTATVPGVDFMHATWRLWFGSKVEQPQLGDQLITLLK